MKGYTKAGRKRRFFDAARDTLLVLIVLAWFMPAVWIIFTSFRARVEVNSRPPVWIPKTLDFESYLILLGAPTKEGAFGMGGEIPFAEYARNSAIIALGATLLALAFGTMAGFIFARFQFRGKNATFLSLMLARAVPGVALSLPLLVLFGTITKGTMAVAESVRPAVPFLADLIAALGPNNSIVGMIIVYTALNVPFTAWLMDGFFRALPEELDDAALIDGCSRWTALLRVDLPLALPGIAASGIFAFLTCWNEFALSIQLTKTPAARTFPPGLFEFTGQFVSDWRGMCAMSVMMLIPAVIFVVLVQRQLVQGLASGAIKG